MPAKPKWFNRIPEILALLENDFPAPWLDRTLVEELFGVAKRSAHGLMHWIGAYRIGDAYAVRRDDLLQWLRALEQTPDVCREIQRHRRVESFLAETRKLRAARQVVIQAEPCRDLLQLAGLCETTSIEPGELRIRFVSAEDLLRQLYELSQALMNDFDHFSELADGSSRRTERLIV